jgi:acetyl esterase/lipase
MQRQDIPSSTSSGGTHAAWCALDPTPLPSPAPGWPLPAGTIKAVVGLSGVYDLSLRIPMPTATFINDVDNYTNTVENGEGVAAIQYNDSPISLVATAATASIPPFLFFGSMNDPVNPAQATNMTAALNSRVSGIAQTYIISGNHHAFYYWHEINPNTGNCVSTDVINFFNTYR